MNSPKGWFCVTGCSTEQAPGIRGAVPSPMRCNAERPAGNGVLFVHVEDAARAALLAIDWPTGVVNIVDDEPAAGTQWLPHFAAIIGAPPPPLGEPGGGNERGASNRRARLHLGWEPLHPTWRDGFRTALD